MSGFFCCCPEAGYSGGCTTLADDFNRAGPLLGGSWEHIEKLYIASNMVWGTIDHPTLGNGTGIAHIKRSAFPDLAATQWTVECDVKNVNGADGTLGISVGPAEVSITFGASPGAEFHLVGGGAAGHTCPATLVADTWYRLKLCVAVANQGDYVAAGYLDGVLVATAYGHVGINSLPAIFASVGFLAPAMEVRFDNFECSTGTGCVDCTPPCEWPNRVAALPAQLKVSLSGGTGGGLCTCSDADGDYWLDLVTSGACEFGSLTVCACYTLDVAVCTLERIELHILRNATHTVQVSFTFAGGGVAVSMLRLTGTAAPVNYCQNANLVSAPPGGGLLYGGCQWTVTVAHP